MPGVQTTICLPANLSWPSGAIIPVPIHQVLLFIIINAFIAFKIMFVLPCVVVLKSNTRFLVYCNSSVDDYHLPMLVQRPLSPRAASPRVLARLVGAFPPLTSTTTNTTSDNSSDGTHMSYVFMIFCVCNVVYIVSFIFLFICVICICCISR